MSTVDFITALFYEVDEQLRAIPKHPEARLLWFVSYHGGFPPDNRGLSSNGAENWDRASSLLDRSLRPPNDHGVFPRIIFCNHLFLRAFMP